LARFLCWLADEEKIYKSAVIFLLSKLHIFKKGVYLQAEKRIAPQAPQELQARGLAFQEIGWRKKLRQAAKCLCAAFSSRFLSNHLGFIASP